MQKIKLMNPLMQEKMKFRVNFQLNNEQWTKIVSLPAKHERSFERLLSKLKPLQFYVG